MTIMLVCVSTILYTITIALGASLPLPPYLKACSRNDPNLNECALKQAINSIPELVKGDRKYRIPQLDPLFIPEITVENDGGLNIVMKDVNIYGPGSVKLKDVGFDLENKKIHVNGVFPNIDIKSNLNISGRVLVFPVTGGGNSWMNLTDLDAMYTTDFRLEERGGKQYLVPENDNFKFAASGFKMKVERILNDNNGLITNNVNSFLSENWQTVLNDVSPTVGKAFGTTFTQLVTNVAELVPYDSLFPETI